MFFLGLESMGFQILRDFDIPAYVANFSRPVNNRFVMFYLDKFS